MLYKVEFQHKEGPPKINAKLLEMGTYDSNCHVKHLQDGRLMKYKLGVKYTISREVNCFIPFAQDTSLGFGFGHSGFPPIFFFPIFITAVQNKYKMQKNQMSIVCTKYTKLNT